MQLSNEGIDGIRSALLLYRPRRCYSWPYPLLWFSWWCHVRCDRYL